jgi:AcrR family transcriptional regulator
MLTDRQADTLAGLLDATAEELRAVGWSGLTMRKVARRAGVAPATAYTYFASREHLVTEVYRRRVRSLADPVVELSDPVAVRATAVLEPMALLVADEPELAAAVTVAMLSEDPEVRRQFETELAVGPRDHPRPL